MSALFSIAFFAMGIIFTVKSELLYCFICYLIASVYLLSHNVEVLNLTLRKNISDKENTESIKVLEQLDKIMKGD